MSQSSTPKIERDAALLAIGAQCTEPSCHLVDFLPFKCQHCAGVFCQEHFRARAPTDWAGTSHACAHYDESKANRVAPSCPLCSTPIAIPLGEDPNLRMDQHLTSACPAITGKQASKSSVPHCARAKCGKALYAPINCDKCHQQFCPTHRFPTTHECASTRLAATLPSTSSGSSSKSTTPHINVAQVGARGAAAMAAIKRQLASAPTSSASTSASARRPSTQTPDAPALSTTSSGSAASSSSVPPRKLNPLKTADRSPPSPAPALAPSPRDASPSPVRTLIADAMNANKPDPIIDPLAWRPPPLFTAA